MFSQPRPAHHGRSDAWLLERVRVGDAHAFEILFHRYYDPLCRAIAGVVGDRDAVEDIVQGVLTRLWDARQTLNVPESLSNYLHAAVRRRAIDQLRFEEVRRRAAPLLVIESGEHFDATESTFDADVLRHRFARAVAALPARTREAFVLSRREGLSYDQIGLRMGISVKTVGVHIGKSLTALRKVIPLVVAALGGGSLVS